MERPKPKSKTTARVLWALTGFVGGHKFYLDRILGGLVDLTLFVFGVMFIVIWATALDARGDASVILLILGVALVLFWLALWIYQGCMLERDVSEYNRRIGHAPDSSPSETPLMASEEPTTPAGGRSAGATSSVIFRPGGNLKGVSGHGTTGNKYTTV